MYVQRIKHGLNEFRSFVKTGQLYSKQDKQKQLASPRTANSGEIGKRGFLKDR